MTSFAFILGVLPLVLATGAGKNGRQSVGTTVFGGMLAATTLNLLFIPLLYIALRTLQEGRGKGGRKPEIEEHPEEQERVAV
jgi:HAE1 family hydrophobic/amphiphilic exporter-1